MTLGKSHRGFGLGQHVLLRWPSRTRSSRLAPTEVRGEKTLLNKLVEVETSKPTIDADRLGNLIFCECLSCLANNKKHPSPRGVAQRAGKTLDLLFGLWLSQSHEDPGLNGRFVPLPHVSHSDRWSANAPPLR